MIVWITSFWLKGLDDRLKDPLDGVGCTSLIFGGRFGLLIFTPTRIGDCDEKIVEKVVLAEVRGIVVGGIIVGVVGADNFLSESGISSKLSDIDGGSFLSVSSLIS